MYTKSTTIFEGDSGSDSVKLLTTVFFFEKEIIEICMNLDITKSKVLVEIPPILYKKNVHYPFSFFITVIQMNFTNSCFPNDWKQAITSPLFRT